MKMNTTKIFVATVTASAAIVLLLSLSSNSSAALIAHWALDETTGTTAVDSVGGNNGTLQGGMTFDADPNGFGTVPGVFGNALEGYSDTEYVDVGDVLNPGTTDYSVTLWFKPTRLAGTSFLVSKGNETTAVPGWSFYHSSARYFDYRSSAGTGNRKRQRSHPSGSSNLNVGQWYHLAMVLDHNPTVPDPNGSDWNQTSYLDGNLVTTLNINEAIVGAITTTEPIWFGRRVSAGTPFVSEGALDDIGIFDEALTQQQVINIMNNGVPEPSAVILLLLGVTGSALVFRRHRKRGKLR